MDETSTVSSPTSPGRGRLVAIIVLAGAALLELAYGCVGEPRIEQLVEDHIGVIHQGAQYQYTSDDRDPGR